MQQKPANWPAESPVELIPEMFVQFRDSTWPPASEETPQGTTPVGSWSVNRQLTGGMLPTQVRGVSGHSIASGSVQIPQRDKAMSPWGFGQYRLGPGGRCTLYASQAGGYTTVPDRRIELGQFMVAPISGASMDAVVNLELDEFSMRLRKPFKLDWTYVAADRLDASWVVYQVAKAGGYLAVPNTVSSTRLSFPLQGSIAPDKAASIPNVNATGDLAWSEHDGQIGLGPGGTVLADASDDPDVWVVTLDHNGLGSVVLRVPGCENITFTVAAASVTATRDSVETLQVQILGALPSTAGWRRVQFQVDLRTFSLRARAEGTAYGSYDSKPWTPVRSSPPRGSVRGIGSAIVRGVQFTADVDTDLWARPRTARINPTGSILTGLFDVPLTPGWDLLQEIASSTGGAVWMDETGTLIYRSRHLLRGTGSYGETIDALDKMESLAWRVDPADQADRVELTYEPTAVSESLDATTLWEAESLVLVKAATPTTLFVDIEGTTDRLSRWTPVWDESALATQLSRWAASYAIDGSGTRPESSALTVTAEMVGVSRVKITLTNNTEFSLWMVDGNGSPALILRTSLLVSTGNAVTINKGKGDEDAENPLSLSTGMWVQNADSAQQILHWTAGETEVAQPVLEGVRVVPDLSRQLGDLVRVIDPVTGLRSKALISGIGLSGDASGYSQNLDLSLVSLTFADWETQMQGAGVTSFTDLDNVLQAQNIRSFDDFDQWGQDFGGTL